MSGGIGEGEPSFVTGTESKMSAVPSPKKSGL